MQEPFDVAILGGGKAGNLLARQIRRHAPSASVVLIEKSRERSFKVGESTVDVCGKYLTKRLGLSTYLYDQHLPKNGLRFFFDREDKRGGLEELSEIGTGGLIPFPSFQIDRARLEEDLLRMNAAAGVDVRLGVRVGGVTLGSPHEITLEEDGRAAGSLRARWLLDASGRSSVLARRLGVRTESLLKHAAAWGRYRGVLDLDDVGSEAFHARVRHTSRVLSTNHFCYPGYWIWLIPLGRGVTSVGVVMRKEDFRPELRTARGLTAFVRSHAAVGSLLEKAEAIDAMSFGQLAYGTTRFADARARWALVGEAAAFTDPLYSPGGDYIALENDWATDLVRRDLSGEDETALARRASLYERALLGRLEGTQRLYDGLYGTLGSFELFASKWDLDTACYLNLWVEPYLLDRHLDLGAVQRELDAHRSMLGVLETFRRLFLEAERELRVSGRFFEKNVGHVVLDPALRFLGPGFGTVSSERRQLPRVRDALQLVLDEVRAKLGRPPSPEPVPLSVFTLGRSIA